MNLNSPLFRKPNWLKPEINTWNYWIHIYLISLFVLFMIQYFQGGEILTLKNVFFLAWLLTAGDIISHTLLGFD